MNDVNHTSDGQLFNDNSLKLAYDNALAAGNVTAGDACRTAYASYQCPFFLGACTSGGTEILACKSICVDFQICLDSSVSRSVACLSCDLLAPTLNAASDSNCVGTAGAGGMTAGTEASCTDPVNPTTTAAPSRARRLDSTISLISVSLVSLMAVFWMAGQ
mmetsp:Transcript_14663/g.22780  ORF Transcript_14663/g.22780 Transcript_14663/m.22780 type:complete len:161 (+) Transcript_14663:149-631(+)